MEQDDRALRILGQNYGSTVNLLEKYIAEIELFNDALGLVGAKDRRELTVKHILDSLAPLGTVARFLETAAEAVDGSRTGVRQKIADVGSGAGLPGIPLAAALPQTDFTLIERMGRRAGFLRNTAAVLELSNVEIDETEMEKAAPGRFAVVAFRAFRPLAPPVLKNLLRLAAPGAVLAAWKGRRENAEAELAALGGMDAEIIPCPVPFLDEERHLVVIKRAGEPPSAGPC
jgi:16S rRNA (guanine527-N7)-methyltransferase